LREGRLTGYGWSPRGDEVWMSVVSGATSELRAFRPGGPERVLVALPGEFLLQDIARDGRVLAERLTERDEMIVAGPGRSPERNLSWLDGSIPADISPDGSTVLFTESGAGSGGVDEVYLRRTDGSDAVRLGEGFALALSPDGKWALARRGADTVLIPTGAGQSQPVSASGVTFDRGGTFSPDGAYLILSGTPPEGDSRLYEWSLESGAARAVTPGGTVLEEGFHTVSPDGRAVVARDRDGKWAIYSLRSGSPSPVPIAVEGLESGDEPIRWTVEGRRLFVLAKSGSVFRLDPATGRRELYRETRPASVVHPTPDGAACVYGYGRHFSHLMLIEGIH
ncbi:MAG TPA: hypothetical protein VIB08_11430, partial [Thermoanaerobaculia bacterium]